MPIVGEQFVLFVLAFLVTYLMERLGVVPAVRRILEVRDVNRTNIDAMERRRYSVAFAVDYDDDLIAAQRIVREAAADHERITERPSPEVNLSELADSYVEGEALVWTAATAPTGTILSEVRKPVKTRFDTANIEMPYPYRQLTGDFEIEDGHGNPP